MLTTLLILVCLLINAFLTAIEISFVSVTKSQIKSLVKSGHKRAVDLLRLRENPERTLSTMQIGITLVGAISAATGGLGASETIAPWLQNYFPIGEVTSNAFALILVIVPITFFSVVLGELVPKTLAMRDPLRIALSGAPVILNLDRLMSPIINILESSTRFVLGFFQTSSHKMNEETSSPEVNLGRLSAQHQQYVMNLYHIEQLRIRDILLKWSNVSTIRVTQPTSEILGAVVTSGHTRLPVCNEKGEVLGILHAKEFMAYLATGAENWQSLIRPVLRIPDTDSILGALRLMQEKRSHLSIVYTNQGQLGGIVTLEDIIEEIVGDIFDEDDDGAIKRIIANATAVSKLK